MDSLHAPSLSDLKNYLSNNQIEYVLTGVFDIDGLFRGKRVRCKKFIKMLDEGFGFCDVVLGWDIEDKLYDKTTLTGWDKGFPDAKVKLVPETARAYPFSANTILVLGEFDGAHANICPRNILKNVLARAKHAGYEINAAFEYEFFVFDETPTSIHAKQFSDLQPFTPGAFGYSVLRGTTQAAFHDALLTMSDNMDFPLEGLHTETGPGVLEAAIEVDNALAAADKAALFKTFTKALAQEHGLMATFMARWSENVPGQSGHIHISITDKDGKSIFYDQNADNYISTSMQHFIAGQVKLMPEFTSLFAPTINSYTRLVPGFWAPTHANWGVDNRTTALRAIVGSSSSQRVEYRAAGSDANPYLALAGAIASGLWGIEQQLSPPKPVKGNAYTQQHEHSLPGNLHIAASQLNDSLLAKELLGKEFIEHFVHTREWESRLAQQAVTNWQLQRYFEAI